MEIIKRKEAQQKGLVHYYTGKPCKYGHIDRRRTANGFCLACEKIKQSKEEYKRYQESYRNAPEHKEKQRQVHKKWRDENNEYKKQWDSKYYYDNWQHCNERQSKYYQKNRLRVLEYCKDYLKNNRAKIYAYQAGRRIRTRNATLAIDEEQVKNVYQRAIEIRSLGLNVHVDHVVPITSEIVCGLHSSSNLEIIYAEDNLSKSNKFTPYAINHLTGEVTYYG